MLRETETLRYTVEIVKKLKISKEMQQIAKRYLNLQGDFENCKKYCKLQRDVVTFMICCK